jgi:hypothetical protein
MKMVCFQGHPALSQGTSGHPTRFV